MQKTILIFFNFAKCVYSFLTICIFRLTKWFLRKFTKLTELQRIIYGELRGCRRIRNVEEALERSRDPGIIKQLRELERGVNDGRFDWKGTRKVLSTQSAVNITRAKGINLKSHSRFVTALAECLEIIYAFKCLKVKLEMLRTTSYDHENVHHEAKLLELWDNLMAPEKLSGRKSRQWQDIGFQGNDPATDFRGAGFLALETLLYMSRNYPSVAKQLISNSHHPMYSYPFALLSIQITYMAAELCCLGPAKTHFYNRAGIILTLDERAKPTDRTMWGDELLILFYDLCCAFMIEFDAYWFASKPKDIMEFGRIKSEFDKVIKKKLRDDNTCFLMEVRTI